MNEKFSIWFEPDAWLRVSTLARECTHEISGLGRIRLDDDGTVVITEIVVLKQEGTGATTHLDMDAVAEFLAEDLKTRIETGEVGQTSFLMWWHSHPGSGIPSYSSTDHTTIGELADNAASGECPAFFGVCIAGDGKGAKAYLELRKPVSIQVEGEVKVLANEAEQTILEWAKAQIKEKIVKPVFAGGHRGGSNVPFTGTPNTHGGGRIRDITPYKRTYKPGDYQYFDNFRYMYVDKKPKPLWVPSPTDYVKDLDKAQYALLPNRDGEQSNFYLLPRVVEVAGTPPVGKSGKGIRLSTEDKALRAVIKKLGVAPGSLLLVPDRMWTLCIVCGRDAASLADHPDHGMISASMCFGCELAENGCTCPPKVGSVQDIMANSKKERTLHAGVE